MNIEEKTAEILRAKGTVQFLELEYISPFVDALASQVGKLAIKPVLVDIDIQGNISFTTILINMLDKMNTQDSSVIKKTEKIIQGNVLESLTRNEIGGIFDNVLESNNQRSLVIVILRNKISEINLKLLEFIDDILSVPIITDIQWCFVSSSTELMVLLGLITPEEYFSSFHFTELHRYKGNFSLEAKRDIKRSTGRLVRHATVEVKAEDLSVLRLQLSLREWARLGTIDDCNVSLKKFVDSIDFVIYRTDVGNCILINLSPDNSISLSSPNTVKRRKFRSEKQNLEALIKNQKIFFFENSLEGECELDIQFPYHKIRILISGSSYAHRP